MQQTAIYSDTLGIFPPWQVTFVVFSARENRLEITVAFDYANHEHCPICGGTMVPTFGTQETWHHDSFFQHPTYLYAHVPRLECPCGNELSVERPWSRAGSRFALMTQAEHSRHHARLTVGLQRE